jgi:hypothetical protein
VPLRALLDYYEDKVADRRSDQPPERRSCVMGPWSVRWVRTAGMVMSGPEACASNVPTTISVEQESYD